MSAADDLRWCVYCGADCWPDRDDQDHAADCPQATGIYPVTEQDLGIRGPDDPYAHGMVCGSCDTQFGLGDSYMLWDVGDGDVAIQEVVCLGCVGHRELTVSEEAR